MIFVSGIHGVGKTYFCNTVREKLGIKSYTASQLIEAKKNKSFLTDKRVSDVDINQIFLLEAIDELRQSEKEFILDGHFCLLNTEGEISRIPKHTYSLLKPSSIILLTEKPEVIAERRYLRDGMQQELSEIKAFQDAEKNYAIEIAAYLGISIEILDGTYDIERVIQLIGGR